MTNKRIVFHIGMHKTGSSAIQAYLSANVQSLRLVGIDYPFAEGSASIQTGFCSGNIVQVLFRELLVELDEARLDSGGDDLDRLYKVAGPRLFERLSRIAAESHQQTVLFSGETLMSLEYEGWRLLANLKNHFTVELVGFVRDPFDYVYSAWRQHLKAGEPEASETFEDYVKAGDPSSTGYRMAKGYRGLVASGLRDNLTLYNYDKFRGDIVGAFFKAARLQRPVDDGYRLREEPYNPSLTTSEASIVSRTYAALRNADFTNTIVKILMDRPREARRESGYYSSTAHKLILDRFNDVIADMNEIIVGDPLSATVRDQPGQQASIEVADLDVLLEVVKKALESDGSAASSQKEPVRLDGEGIPIDFDPTAYLFLNKDVAEAGMDPRQHYALWGRNEFRRYKYF